MSEKDNAIEKMLNEKVSKEALKVLEDYQKTSEVEAEIKDNKVMFILGKQKYRIRTPNQEEIIQIDNAKEEKLTECIRNKNYMSEDYWKRIWKEKGFDLDELENKIQDIKDGMYDLLFKLATVTSKQDRDTLKDRIEEKKRVLNELIIKKVDKLQYSIEQKMRDNANFYISYLMLEKADGDKWERNFKTYDDFMKSDNPELVNKAIEFTMRLLYGTIEGLD